MGPAVKNYIKESNLDNDKLTIFKKRSQQFLIIAFTQLRDRCDIIQDDWTQYLQFLCPENALNFKLHSA